MVWLSKSNKKETSIGPWLRRGSYRCMSTYKLTIIEAYLFYVVYLRIKRNSDLESTKNIW